MVDIQIGQNNCVKVYGIFCFSPGAQFRFYRLVREQAQAKQGHSSRYDRNATKSASVSESAMSCRIAEVEWLDVATNKKRPR